MNSLDRQTRPLTIEELLDREQIRDVLARYCRGVDRNDAELVESVFWPDATDDHGIGACGNAHEFIALMRKLASTLVLKRHQIGNVLICLDGANAKVETYVTGYLRMEGATQPYWRTTPSAIPPDQVGKYKDLFVGARHLDRMTRREGIWRIQHRSVVYDWYKVIDGDSWSAFPYPGHESFAMGSLSADDPSCRHFKDWGSL